MIAVAMDSRVPTFRHERYPAYKANREKAPEDLHAQVPVIEEILAALRVPCVRADGFEADDVIATLAERCRPSARAVLDPVGRQGHPAAHRRQRAPPRPGEGLDRARGVHARAGRRAARGPPRADRRLPRPRRRLVGQRARRRRHRRQDGREAARAVRGPRRPLRPARRGDSRGGAEEARRGQGGRAALARARHPPPRRARAARPLRTRVRRASTRRPRCPCSSARACTASRRSWRDGARRRAPRRAGRRAGGEPTAPPRSPRPPRPTAPAVDRAGHLPVRHRPGRARPADRRRPGRGGVRVRRGDRRHRRDARRARSASRSRAADGHGLLRPDPRDGRRMPARGDREGTPPRRCSRTRPCAWSGRTSSTTPR